MSEHEPPITPRSSFASVLLTGLFIAFFGGLLIVATGGWFFNLLAAFAVILGFAGIHYLLWGWLMPREAAQPDPDEEDSDKAPAPGWPLPDSDRFTRL